MTKYGAIPTEVDNIRFAIRSINSGFVPGEPWYNRRNDVDACDTDAAPNRSSPSRRYEGYAPLYAMPARLDVTGQRFGRLVALKHEGWNGAHKTLWSFRCDCGTVVIRRLATVRRGETSSCGCLRREGGYEAPNRKARGESSFNTLYTHYAGAARARGYEFALDREQFRELTCRPCTYCGIPPSQVTRATSGTNGTYTYTGVDRVDNALGYVPGNVVPCCSTCNRAKHAMSHDEFVAWIRRAHRHLRENGDGE